jgi:hypothetical protein
MAMNSGIKSTLSWVIGLVTISLVLLVSLIIFGNLSGNLGFATNTQGYNDTQNVINNYTGGTAKLVTQIPTVFLFVGIALLLFVLIGVLAWVIKKMVGFGSGKGSTE